MLPTYRGSMGEMFVRHNLIGGPHVLHCFTHICCIPINDGADDEVQPRCPVLLGLMATIDDAPLTESVNRLGKSMALLAVVETGVAASPQLGAFQPIQHE